MKGEDIETVIGKNKEYKQNPITDRNKNRNDMGFILYSTLISMMISIIVLTLLLGIVFYAVMWDAKLLDSVAMMEDGHIYTAYGCGSYDMESCEGYCRRS